MSPGCSSARLSAWLRSRCAGAQLRRGRRPFRPDPHRGLFAGERHQRVNRTGRLDVERKPRPPHPLGRLDFLAAAVAGNLELRHRRALRRRERNFEIPARHIHVGLRRRSVDTVRQGRHLQQGLPRDGGIGVVEQMMRGRLERRMRRDRGRCDGLGGRQRAANRRRRRVGVKGHVRATSVFRCGGCAHRVAKLLQRFLQQVQGRTGRRSGVERRRKRIAGGLAGQREVFGDQQPRLRQQDFLDIEIGRRGRRKARGRWPVATRLAVPPPASPASRPSH